MLYSLRLLFFIVICWVIFFFSEILNRLAGFLRRAAENKHCFVWKRVIRQVAALDHVFVIILSYADEKIGFHNKNSSWYAFAFQHILQHTYVIQIYVILSMQGWYFSFCMKKWNLYPKSLLCLWTDRHQRGPGFDSGYTRNFSESMGSEIGSIQPREDIIE